MAISFVITLVLSYVLLKRGKTKSSRILSISSFGASVWILAMLFFVNLGESFYLLVSTKILYIAGTIVVTNFFYFTQIFTGNNKKENKVAFQISVILLVLSIILISFTETIIRGVEGVGIKKVVYFGSLYLLYSIYLIGWAFLAYWKLFKKFVSIGDRIKKRQLGYVLFGTILPMTFGLMFDVILPWFGNFNFYWVGPAIAPLYVVFISYAIFKYHLFNIKVIATELFIGLLLLFLLFNVFIAPTLNYKALNVIVFMVASFFGIFIIKSVHQEIRGKEEIQRMSWKLQKAYQELKKLDEAKSEFIAMASHQLRTPLSIIKGYISMLIEGSYGKLEQSPVKVLKKVFGSNERLVKIVNDLLSMSKIELGKLDVVKKKTQIQDLINAVLEELKPRADTKNLNIKFEKSEQKLPEIKIDSLKIRQVIFTVVDNAIRYTEKGDITIKTRALNSKIQISVSDTGVGMAKKETEKIFESFTRGAAGINLWIQGTGLGLYLAKKYVELHNGRIWAESLGKEKGSTFYIELPIK